MIRLILPRSLPSWVSNRRQLCSPMVGGPLFFTNPKVGGQYPGVSTTLLTKRWTGSLKDPTLIPADFSFDNSVTVINGKEKAMFIRFIDKMIRWDPKERSTANELLQEPWLHEDFPEDTT